MSYSNYQLNQRINNLQNQINNLGPSGSQNIDEVLQTGNISETNIIFNDSSINLHTNTDDITITALNVSNGTITTTWDDILVGSSGTVPNLQQVCSIGSSTNRQIDLTFGTATGIIRGGELKVSSQTGNSATIEPETIKFFDVVSNLTTTIAPTYVSYGALYKTWSAILASNTIPTLQEVLTSNNNSTSVMNFTSGISQISYGGSSVSCQNATDGYWNSLEPYSLVNMNTTSSDRMELRPENITFTNFLTGNPTTISKDNVLYDGITKSWTDIFNPPIPPTPKLQLVLEESNKATDISIICDDTGLTNKTTLNNNGIEIKELSSGITNKLTFNGCEVRDNTEYTSLEVDGTYIYSTSGDTNFTLSGMDLTTSNPSLGKTGSILINGTIKPTGIKTEPKIIMEFFDPAVGSNKVSMTSSVITQESPSGTVFKNWSDIINPPVPGIPTLEEVLTSDNTATTSLIIGNIGSNSSTLSNTGLSVESGVETTTFTSLGLTYSNTTSNMASSLNAGTLSIQSLDTMKGIQLTELNLTVGVEANENQVVITRDSLLAKNSGSSNEALLNIEGLTIGNTTNTNLSKTSLALISPTVNSNITVNELNFCNSASPVQFSLNYNNNQVISCLGSTFLFNGTANIANNATNAVSANFATNSGTANFSTNSGTSASSNSCNITDINDTTLYYLPFFSGTISTGSSAVKTFFSDTNTGPLSYTPSSSILTTGLLALQSAAPSVSYNNTTGALNITTVSCTFQDFNWIIPAGQTTVNVVSFTISTKRNNAMNRIYIINNSANSFQFPTILTSATQTNRVGWTSIQTIGAGTSWMLTVTNAGSNGGNFVFLDLKQYF